MLPKIGLLPENAFRRTFDNGFGSVWNGFTNVDHNNRSTKQTKEALSKQTQDTTLTSIEIWNDEWQTNKNLVHTKTKWQFKNTKHQIVCRFLFFLCSIRSGCWIAIIIASIFSVLESSSLSAAAAEDQNANEENPTWTQNSDFLANH